MVPSHRSHRGCARLVILFCCYPLLELASTPSESVGTFFYDLLFFTGGESILNRPYVLVHFLVAYRAFPDIPRFTVTSVPANSTSVL